MSHPRKEQVFLSYAHEDLDTVYKIYEGLKKRKMTVWFDKENMGSGRWMEQIEQAIAESKYFIVCISDAAITKLRDKKGVQGKELRLAYDIAMNQAPSVFTIIPIRLEECDHGDHRLSTWHQYDLFKNFDGVLDKIAVQHGGISLSKAITKEEKSETENLVDALFGKATTAYYAGDYTKVLKLLDAVVEINPDDAVAWHNQGVVLAKSKKQEEAITAYDKAIGINPDYAQAWASKGVTLVKLNKREEALTAFDKAIEMNPNYAKAWIGKGVVLSTLNKLEKSIAAYDKAIGINPDDTDAWVGKGVVLAKSKKQEKAITAFDKAIEINPDDAKAWAGKGVTLRSLNKPQEARAAFKKAHELDPRHPPPPEL